MLSTLSDLTTVGAALAAHLGDIGHPGFQLDRGPGGELHAVHEGMSDRLHAGREHVASGDLEHAEAVGQVGGGLDVVDEPAADLGQVAPRLAEIQTHLGGGVGQTLRAGGEGAVCVAGLDGLLF